MIARYRDARVARIWSPASVLRRWIRVEVCAMMAREAEGLIPRTTAARAEHLLHSVKVREVARIEKQRQHDVAAMVEACCRRLKAAGVDSIHFHYRMTSSDVSDTAAALAIQASMVAFRKVVARVDKALLRLEGRYPDQAVARTHGRAARPIVFGSRFRVWSDLLREAGANAARVFAGTQLGKLSGPSGREIPVEIEKHVMRLLGLPVVSSVRGLQCVPRHYYYRVFSAISEYGFVLEKMATDLRLLAIEEVGEVNEGYIAGRQGSSSMPHKQNPVNLEKICGMARLLRGHLTALSENSSLWLERDISHSSVERVVFPDFFHILFHMAESMAEVLGLLSVRVGSIYRNHAAAAEAMASFDKLHDSSSSDRLATFSELKSEG